MELLRDKVSIAYSVRSIIWEIHETKHVFAEEPSKRLRKAALLEHLKTKSHESAKYSESLNRVSVFQRELDRKEEVNNETIKY